MNRKQKKNIYLRAWDKKDKENINHHLLFTFLLNTICSSTESSSSIFLSFSASI